MNSMEKMRFLKDAQNRLKKAIDLDAENRKNAIEDLEFVAVPKKQWPDAIRAERESEGRPCLEINKMPAFIDQVVGDQRMNRPRIKVVPVDSDGDPEIARILSGWIKHVEQISKSDVAVDHAFEHAVTCGYGALRVLTKFTGTSFNQEAYIAKIDNALAVYWGPCSEVDCSDAMYCFIITEMDKDEYKIKYNRDPMPFNFTDSRYVEGWVTKDTVRIAEYYLKVPVKKTLYLLADGSTVDKVSDTDVVVRTRKMDSFKIMWYLISGDDILEEQVWPGKRFIPVIPVWGKELNVGGKRYVRGMIRNAKDSQRMYNYWQSCDTEVVALQPKVPYIVTAEQVKGHEDAWKNAHKRNVPYLIVNTDIKAPGWPHREPPPQASSAMVERIQNTDQEMRDTIGLQKASLGMQSNERSGVAIRERKKEGDIGTFSFIDNLSRAIEHVGRVLVDIAPALLDSERVIRLGLENGEHEFAAINVYDRDTGKILNDLSVGTYDVVVTVGPSFTTQRSEARESMAEFIQYVPNAGPLLGDLYAKSMDWPGAEDAAKRLEYLLPPEIRAQKAADEAKKRGEEVPPPSSSPQPPSDPTLEVKVEIEKVKLSEAQVRLKQEEERLKGLVLENSLKEKEIQNASK